MQTGRPEWRGDPSAQPRRVDRGRAQDGTTENAHSRFRSRRARPPCGEIDPALLIRPPEMCRASDECPLRQPCQGLGFAWPNRCSRSAGVSDWLIASRLIEDANRSSAESASAAIIATESVIHVGGRLKADQQGGYCDCGKGRALHDPRFSLRPSIGEGTVNDIAARFAKARQAPPGDREACHAAGMAGRARTLPPAESRETPTRRADAGPWSAQI